MRKRLLVFIVGFFTTIASAQTVSLDLNYFNDYLRDQQLLGNIDSNISWMIKPVHLPSTAANNQIFVGDTNLWPCDAHTYARISKGITHGKVSWQALPIHIRSQYNHLHNYGWQNGAMVPNKGLQTYLSAGLNFRYRSWLEVQLRPEFIRAQNKKYRNPPVRHGGVDMPERMGNEPVQELFAGQSYAKVHWRGLSVGISTENLQWGPARQGSIFLSPSAPGFLHFTVHSNRPIKTLIGHFEGQFVAGRLRFSGFYPYPIDWEIPTTPFTPISSGEITPSALGNGEHSKISMLSGTYAPKWVPGLFVGGAFGVQSRNLPPLIGLLGVFAPGSERANSLDFSSQNAVITLFSRYLIPQSGFELYGEFGRDDWWMDSEDLAIDPFHTTVGLLGLAKIIQLSGTDHYFRFETELTKLMAPMTQISRGPGNSFYTHSNGVGWTHRGQNLGVGLPPGSIRQQIGLLWNKGYHRLGLSLERIEYAQDLFYFRMPYLINPAIGNSLAMDFTKRFVDLVAKVRMQTAYKGLIVGADAMVLHTLNFQWGYIPNGTPEAFRRFPSNYWSVNAHMYAYYRF